MQIGEAAGLLGVQPRELRPFRETDPFGGVEMAGYICRRPDHCYRAIEDGALTVQAVEQLLLEDWEEPEVRASASRTTGAASCVPSRAGSPRR